MQISKLNSLGDTSKYTTKESNRGSNKSEIAITDSQPKNFLIKNIQSVKNAKSPEKS